MKSFKSVGVRGQLIKQNMHIFSSNMQIKLKNDEYFVLDDRATRFCRINLSVGLSYMLKNINIKTYINVKGFAFSNSGFMSTR